MGGIGFMSRVDYIENSDLDSSNEIAAIIVNEIAKLNRDSEISNVAPFIWHLYLNQAAGGMIFLCGPERDGPEKFADRLCKFGGTEINAKLSSLRLCEEESPIDWVENVMDVRSLSAGERLSDLMNEIAYDTKGVIAQRAHDDLVDVLTHAEARDRYTIVSIPVTVTRKKSGIPLLGLAGDSEFDKVVKEFESFISNVPSDVGKNICLLFVVYVYGSSNHEISIDAESTSIDQIRHEGVRYSIDLGDAGVCNGGKYWVIANWGDVESKHAVDFIDAISGRSKVGAKHSWSLIKDEISRKFEEGEKRVSRDFRFVSKSLFDVARGLKE